MVVLILCAAAFYPCAWLAVAVPLFLLATAHVLFKTSTREGAVGCRTQILDFLLNSWSEIPCLSHQQCNSLGFGPGMHQCEHGRCSTRGSVGTSSVVGVRRDASSLSDMAPSWLLARTIPPDSARLLLSFSCGLFWLLVGAAVGSRSLTETGIPSHSPVRCMLRYRLLICKDPQARP